MNPFTLAVRLASLALACFRLPTVTSDQISQMLVAGSHRIVSYNDLVIPMTGMSVTVADGSRPIPVKDVTPQKRTFPIVWSSCQTLTTAVRTSYSAK
jgi:hypothetical protein